MWHTDKNNNKPTGLFFFLFSARFSSFFGGLELLMLVAWETHLAPNDGEKCVFSFFFFACVSGTFMSSPTYTLDVVHCYCYPQAFVLIRFFFVVALSYPRISSHVFIWSRQVKHIEKKDNQCNVCITFIRNAENAVYVSCFMHSHHKLYWFRFDGYE